MTISAAEQKILDDTAAAIARGEDAFGDHDDDTTASQADAGAAEAGATEQAAQAVDENGQADADAAQANEEGKASTDAMDEDMLAEIAGEQTKADPLQLNFIAEVPSDYKAARTSLMAEKAENMAKLMAGDIDAAQFAQEDTRIADSLDELTAARIRAETLIEANAQSAANSKKSVITDLIERTKDEVPYATDTKAQKQFDMAIASLVSDPDNAGKSFTYLTGEAHKVVMALRGVAQKPAAAQAKEARKPDGTPPVTLRSLPSAATSNTGGSITDQLARLSGQDYEVAFSKLTPSQRASLLD